MLHRVEPLKHLTQSQFGIPNRTDKHTAIDSLDLHWLPSGETRRLGDPLWQAYGQAILRLMNNEFVVSGIGC
jgi:hypothetical protein